MSSSVHVRWDVDGGIVLEITRETVESVRIEGQDGGHVITIASSSEGIAATLTVAVSPNGVQIHDALLRS